MSMRRVLPLALGVVLLAGMARGEDEAVTLKLRDPKPGETTWHERSAAADVVLKVTDASGGAVVDRREKATATTTFWQQIVARSNTGVPTKLRRGYGSARVKDDLDFVKPLPFEGKQVNFQRNNDGRYTFQIAKGAELKDKDAQVLSSEFDKGIFGMERVMPDRPVKVGESWNIKFDMPTSIRQDNCAILFDPARAKSTAQLTKVYKKDGVPYGQVVARWEVPVVSIHAVTTKFDLDKGSTFICHCTADVPIDGSSPFGTFKKVAYIKCDDQVTVKGQKFGLSIIVRYDEDETVTAPPKR
ncbi:MAG: hypothetical protein AB7K24_00305 [Gemmataceae bacterium]